MGILLQTLRFAAPAMFALAIGWLVYGVAVAPNKVPNRFGLRGLKRQKALADSSSWASFEPFVRWLGMRVGGVLTPEQRTRVEELLTKAGDYKGLGANEYVALSMLGSIGGSLLGALTSYVTEYPPPLFVIGGTILGLAALHMQLQEIAQKRMLEISRALPYATDVMALAMGAGQDFPGAIRQVVEKSTTPNDPLVEEFTLLLQSFSLGRTRREALLEFDRRCPTESVKEFVNSIVQAEERGNPVAELLGIQASISRNRRSVRAEEEAAKAATKLAIPLMLVLISVMLLLIGPALLNISSTL